MKSLKFLSPLIKYILFSKKINLEHKEINFIEQYINSLLEKDPENPDTLFNISRSLHEKGLYMLSEKYLSFIVVENDQINILRGLNDYMLENYEMHNRI